jgi:hypothetical protein
MTEPKSRCKLIQYDLEGKVEEVKQCTGTENGVVANGQLW